MIVARVPASGLASDDAVGADARDGHGQGGHAVEAAVEIGVAGDADGVDVARAVRLDQDFEEARCFLAGETRRKALAAIDRRDRLSAEAGGEVILLDRLAGRGLRARSFRGCARGPRLTAPVCWRKPLPPSAATGEKPDRKSTRLNSSH